MSRPLRLHEDRLFPADPVIRGIARRLYREVCGLPILSPHGHCDPAWFAADAPFTDAAELLVKPDHYVLRMLYSQGVGLDALGIARRDGTPAAGTETDNREVWRRFASHYGLFLGTPSGLWLDHVFAEIFGFDIKLDADSSDHYYDHINACLARPEFRPRALFERFHIELLATTESPLDALAQHRAIRASGWPGRVITTFRPDPVLDPEFEGFAANVEALGRITGEDTSNWTGYLNALRRRRADFQALGATATDHGHPTAFTADLPRASCERLFASALAGVLTPLEAEQFRGQMLTVMAAMSLDDGLVMQLHPGASRNHNAQLYARYGRDRGADIPVATEYVRALKPLLDRHGNDPRLTLILFTLDESAYARELAPLAGHYPALRLGPAWWFHDSPEGMLRFRRQNTETAGFYNTVGFNDDTRAFLSIPARHDVARRIDCRFLAELVAEHRLDEHEALELAQHLSYRLAKQAYRL